MKGAFSGELHLRYIDGRVWRVKQDPTNPFRFTLDDGRIIEPPDGFITDFASIPRFFWRIFPPTGDGPKRRYGRGAVIHDLLYKTGKISNEVITRLFADIVFLEAMMADAVEKWVRNIMYWAVRTFAWFAWKGKQ